MKQYTSAIVNRAVLSNVLRGERLTVRPAVTMPNEYADGPSTAYVHNGLADDPPFYDGDPWSSLDEQGNREDLPRLETLRPDEMLRDFPNDINVSGALPLL